MIRLAARREGIGTASTDIAVGAAGSPEEAPRPRRFGPMQATTRATLRALGNAALTLIGVHRH
jgi:hypothetical protein